MNLAKYIPVNKERFFLGPSKPLAGMIYYDEATEGMYIYDKKKWVRVNSALLKEEE